jgi:signal recognition particle subunit SEC65
MDIDNADFSARPICLYPIYIDKQKSTRSGRKIPRSQAIDSPSVIYMYEACRRLNLNCSFEGEKRHPSDSLVYGRVLVYLNGMTKLQLLRAVAAMMLGIEQEMIENDPKIKAAAAASRSELSQVVRDIVEEDRKKSKGKGKK